MTSILGVLVFSVILVMIPFALGGWLLAGWRPFIATLVLWAIAVFVFQLWSFGWFYIPFQYLIALAGYAYGGKLRTGKKIEQVLDGEKK